MLSAGRGHDGAGRKSGAEAGRGPIEGRLQWRARRQAAAVGRSVKATPLRPDLEGPGSTHPHAGRRAA